VVSIIEAHQKVERLQVRLLWATHLQVICVPLCQPFIDQLQRLLKVVRFDGIPYWSILALSKLVRHVASASALSVSRCSGVMRLGLHNMTGMEYWQKPTQPYGVVVMSKGATAPKFCLWMKIIGPLLAAFRSELLRNVKVCQSTGNTNVCGYELTG
jgi:hypothetical protein